MFAVYQIFASTDCRRSGFCKELLIFLCSGAFDLLFLDGFLFPFTDAVEQKGEQRTDYPGRNEGYLDTFLLTERKLGGSGEI